MKRTLFCILPAAACFGTIVLTAEAQWLQFRGPGGSGTAQDKGVPATWSDDSNIRWKAEMPGPGASSPIVVGNKVFVTCYSGYGLTRDNPGEQKNLKRHLVCLERQTGKTVWKRDIDPVLPESAFQGPYITMHGYASSTPVSDGKQVFVFFGSAGVFAFDLDGKQLWHASVGKGTHGWGSGASPILNKDLLIVNASVESGSVLALDKKSGTEVWSTKGIRGSWNTPVLVNLAGAAAELALGTQPKMLGLDPDTGKELWRAETYDWYVCPSLVAHDGVLYGLQHSICVAIKAGGHGDVTDSHVIWKKNFGHVVSSPLYHDGHVYWCSSGTVNCVKASDGSLVYKERLKGADETYASPVLADDKIYFVTRSDGVYVVEAGPKFKLLAHNTFNSDTSIFNASPAVSNSQLFLRSDRYLYCLGKQK